MKKLACSLLVILFFVSGIFFIGNVHASKSVSGFIGSDTTWNIAGSPYQFTGPVGVASGVTLKIEPGVTVDFGNYYLQINGTLTAIGTSENNIYLKTEDSWTNPLQQIQFMPSSASWNDQTNSGSIVENVNFYQVSIVAKGCSPKISNNIFNSPFWMAVLSTDGSPTIINNVIENVTVEGMSVSGSSTVTNNLFNGTNPQNGQTATAIVTHGNAYVSNNKILNYFNGITAGDQSAIKGNVIVNCSNTGVSTVSANAIIENNYIVDNNIGISFGGGSIKNNAINNRHSIPIPSCIRKCS